MLYPSDISYTTFSDAQVRLFAKCAEAEYKDDLPWRKELDEAARDLIIGNLSQQWDSPSAILKKLKLIAKNPDRFFGLIAKNDADAMSDPVATALRHGTGWTDEQLLDAAKHRDEFLQGVEREIAFLERLVGRRKAMGKQGHAGDPAMKEFINRLAWVYQDAFLQEAEVAAPVVSGSIGGAFVGFAKEVIASIECNLSVAVRQSAPSFCERLNDLANEDDTGVWNQFIRSEYYGVVRDTGRFPDLQ